MSANRLGVGLTFTHYRVDEPAARVKTSLHHLLDNVAVLPIKDAREVRPLIRYCYIFSRSE